MTIKFAIITCSDTRTLETDEAGQKLEQLIAERGWECVRRVVEMDERPFIAGALIDACDNTDADIVLTCGGSGLSLRDVTPEATRDVADREVPGIAEAMRAHSVAITPFAMLSRAICAQRGHTLIINLPGSTKAATENWEGIVEALPHAVKMMAGEGHSTQKDLSEKLAAAAARGELGYGSGRARAVGFEVAMEGWLRMCLPYGFPGLGSRGRKSLSRAKRARSRASGLRYTS